MRITVESAGAGMRDGLEMDLAALRANPEWTGFEFSEPLGRALERAQDEAEFAAALAVGGAS